MKILFLTGSRTDPSSRFRIWQFVEPLTARGHRVTVRVPFPARTWSIVCPGELSRRTVTRCGALWRIGSVIWNLRDAASYDVIMMNRDLVPESGITFLEPWLAKKNPRLIFDFDDAIHLGKREKKLRHALPQFAWITPGNAYLAEFAWQVNRNVTILPTVVNTDLYMIAPARKPGPVRVGWSGSDSTARYCLPLLQEPIQQLARTERFEFAAICNVNPQLHWEGVSTRFTQWTPDTEVSGLQEFDIGLMPLKDEPFERGKCGLKAIQYMSVGVPALVSPVGVNEEIVEEGKHGFHCRTVTDWVDRLKILIRDEALRKRMGAAARDRVVRLYSVKFLLPNMVEILEKVAGRPS